MIMNRVQPLDDPMFRLGGHPERCIEMFRDLPGRMVEEFQLFVVAFTPQADEPMDPHLKAISPSGRLIE